MTPDKENAIEALRRIWKAFPEWRIGQLVANVAAWSGKKTPGNVWDVENVEFSQTVDRYFEKKKRPYLLVLQWPASSITDYDRLIELETYLIENLRDGSLVDGHDAGSGEMNIFIFTDDPKRTFSKARPLLENCQAFDGLRAGIQVLGEVQYAPYWPENLLSFNVT